VSCEQSRGTAFAVRKNLYMTAKHVIQNCNNLELINNSGKSIKGRIEFQDPIIDLALISTPDQISKIVEFNESEVSVGDVEIVGSPIDGLVLSFGKIIGTANSGEISELRLRIAADHGNSGGPVFLENKLVGMVYQKNFANGDVTAIALPSIKSGLDHYDLAVLKSDNSSASDIEVFGSNISQLNLLLVSLGANLLAFVLAFSVYLRSRRSRYIVSRKRIRVHPR
jgi:hypothetical protein